MGHSFLPNAHRFSAWIGRAACPHAAAMAEKPYALLALVAVHTAGAGLVMGVDNKLALYRQEVHDAATGAYSTNWCVVAGSLSGEDDELMEQWQGVLRRM